MRVIRANAGITDWKAVRCLLQNAFAYMQAQLGHFPPAVMQSVDELAAETANGPVFLSIQGGTPVACLFCRPSRDHPGSLYLGKMAVAQTYRGTGLARVLVEAACDAARDDGLTALTLDTGVSLTELHATFQRLGFGTPVPRHGEAGVVTMMRRL